MVLDPFENNAEFSVLCCLRRCLRFNNFNNYFWIRFSRFTRDVHGVGTVLDCVWKRSPKYTDSGSKRIQIHQVACESVNVARAYICINEQDILNVRQNFSSKFRYWLIKDPKNGAHLQERQNMSKKISKNAAYVNFPLIKHILNSVKTCCFKLFLGLVIFT